MQIDTFIYANAKISIVFVELFLEMREKLMNTKISTVT